MTVKAWLPSLTLRWNVREIVWNVRIAWLVVAGAIVIMPEEQLVKPKDPNKSTDEQHDATKSTSNDLADSKSYHKRKRQDISGGRTCKKRKVS